MRDIMGLMSKAKEMQEKMQAMQAEMETMTADGTAGGGMVSVPPAMAPFLTSGRDPAPARPASRPSRARGS